MNAKTELQGTLKDYALAKIKCAEVFTDNYDEESRVFYRLKTNHTAADLDAFFNLLDFEYDSGFGGQKLFGLVWLEDGTWLSRGEYDGSEWWEHNSLPEIPAELL